MTAARSLTDADLDALADRLADRLAARLAPRPRPKREEAPTVTPRQQQHARTQLERLGLVGSRR